MAPLYRLGFVWKQKPHRFQSHFHFGNVRAVLTLPFFSLFPEGQAAQGKRRFLPHLFGHEAYRPRAEVELVAELGTARLHGPFGDGEEPRKFFRRQVRLHGGIKEEVHTPDGMDKPRRPRFGLAASHLSPGKAGIPQEAESCGKRQRTGKEK